MAKKVNIELRPYDALGILAFLREYFNPSNKKVKEFAAMHESVSAFEKQVFDKITTDMLEDAELECSINIITKRQPQ